MNEDKFVICVKVGEGGARGLSWSVGSCSSSLWVQFVLDVTGETRNEE